MRTILARNRFRGWILNEIFRRADERGRTMGEFLDEEIVGPMQADVYIGVSRDKARYIQLSVSLHARN